MAEGWIKLWRKLRDNPWLQDAAQRAVFCTLLLDAETEDRDCRGAHGIIPIRRGQSLITSDGLARELGVGRQTIRRAISKLKQGGLINPTPTNGGTIITICHFDKYQNVGPSDQPTPNQRKRVSDTTFSQNPTSGPRGDRSYISGAYPLDQPTDQPTTQPATNQRPNHTLRREEEEESKIPPSPSESPPQGGPKQGRRISPDFWPSEDAIKHCREALGCSTQLLEEEFPAFKGHFLVATGATARKLDWDQTFVNWMRRARRDQIRREQALQRRDERYATGAQR